MKKKEVKIITFTDIWDYSKIPECDEIPEEQITSDELRRACGIVGFMLNGDFQRTFYVPQQVNF